MVAQRRSVHSRRRCDPVGRRFGLAALTLGFAFVALFLLNAVVNGWSTAYDVALTIVSPWDRGRVRTTALAAPLSVAGWLLVPSVVGALAGYLVSQVGAAHAGAAAPDADPATVERPGVSPAGSAGGRHGQAGSGGRSAESQRTAHRGWQAPVRAPAGDEYGPRGREILAEARRAAELAQALAELLATTPSPVPGDTEVVRQITGRAEVALRIAEELALAGPAGTPSGLREPGRPAAGSQLARELATLEHLVGRVPGQRPEVNRVCAALTTHLRHFRVQVEELGTR
jgi:hypothetical protein